MEMDSKRGWLRMDQCEFIDMSPRVSALSILVKQLRIVLIIYSINKILN